VTFLIQPCDERMSWAGLWYGVPGIRSRAGRQAVVARLPFSQVLLREEGFRYSWSSAFLAIAAPRSGRGKTRA